MYIPGQKVVCINDGFHRSIAEWTDHVPRKGCVYTVKRVVPAAPEVVTRKPGPGLWLEEAPTFENRVCFSAWRFVPLEDEFMRLVTAEHISDAGVVVGQAFQPAGALDSSPVFQNGRLESRPHRQTGLSALRTGCHGMKPHLTRIGIPVSRRYSEERHRLEAGSANAECAARLRAIATATEPLTFGYGHTLQPGQLLAELAVMRCVPVHCPTLGFADAMLACGLLDHAEEMTFLYLESRARFTGSWQRRLQRFSANVLAHAEAAELGITSSKTTKRI